MVDDEQPPYATPPAPQHATAGYGPPQRPPRRSGPPGWAIVLLATTLALILGGAVAVVAVAGAAAVFIAQPEARSAAPSQAQSAVPSPTESAPASEAASEVPAQLRDTWARISIVLPEAVGGLPRDREVESRPQMDSWLTGPLSGGQLGVYSDRKPGSKVLVVRAKRSKAPMSPSEQEAKWRTLTREMENDAKKYGALRWVEQPVGPLGGRMACATHSHDTTVCVAVDAAVVMSMMRIGPPLDLAGTAVVRELVEQHRG